MDVQQWALHLYLPWLGTPLDFELTNNEASVLVDFSFLFFPQELEGLRRLKEDIPDVAIFFVKVPSQDVIHQIEMGRTAPHIIDVHKALRRNKDDTTVTSSMTSCMTLFNQLVDVGYLSPLPNDVITERSDSDCESDYSRSYKTKSELIYDYEDFSRLGEFVRSTLRDYLIGTTTLLNLIHTRCLDMFIQSAFDMARDMLITPKR